MSRYTTDQVYDRGVIHAEAKAAGMAPGNRTAGIVEIGDELCVFWNPYRKLYSNEWIDEPQAFIYSGEGSSGPMGETAGNRRLLDAEADQSEITVFYKTASTGSRWLCLGAYEITSHNDDISQDKTGAVRPDIRFRFERRTSTGLTHPIPVIPAPTPAPPTEQQLWDAAERTRAKSGGKRRRRDARSRD